eukprot:3953381-Amphidinium_carterae.1
MVFHQVHDRANVWSFRKPVSAWHHASTTSKSHKASGDSLPELLTWHVTCGCAAHDMHNSLKWAVGIGSHWITSVLEPLSADSLPSPDVLRTCYTSFGVGSELLALLCDELQLNWDAMNKKLHVRDIVIDREGWQTTLCAVLLDMWRIQSFSSRRWLTVGTGCRRLIHVEALVHHRVLLWGLSKLYYGRCIRILCLVTALVALVPDAILQDILHEPQFCKICLSLLEDLSVEIEFLENLEPDCWKWFCGHLSCQAVHLRNAVVHAAYVAWGYIDGKMFQAVSELPWALAV